MPVKVVIKPPLVSTVGEEVLPATYQPPVHTPQATSEPIALGVYNSLADEAMKQGFRLGTLVCERNGILGRQEMMRAASWGVVSDIKRHRHVDDAYFKPIEVRWLRLGSMTRHQAGDLVILNPAPEKHELFSKINAALSAFC